MKTMIKIATALLITVTVISCGPSYMTVHEKPTSPYYDRPVSPGAGYIWRDGGWYWRGGNYRYRQGYWTVPPPRRTWAPGYWNQHRNGGYYWRRGHWRR